MILVHSWSRKWIACQAHIVVMNLTSWNSTKNKNENFYRQH